MEAEKALFNYGCAMTARGLNKDELSILMRDHNSRSDTPLSDGKVDELIESAFMFTMKNDTNINLPTITATQRQLLPLLNEIYESLRPDVTLYRHGGGLVSLRNGIVSHYTAESMPKLLSARANYVNGKTNDSMFPPMVAAKAVLYSLDDEDKIRSLKHITNVPVLRPDGTVLDSPGYDTPTGIYYHPTGKPVQIPERPTQTNAREAAAWLLDMIGEFPFESESDQTNYIGLLLTFVVRELCGCVPLTLIDAPSAGTGKSLLSKIAAITATGKTAVFGVQLGSEEEMRKNITSRLRESPSILITDNAEEVIKSAVMATLLTTEEWEDRLLGRNRVLRLPVRAVMVFTGNNLRLGGDMPRRCYRVRLDANAARPWMRGGFRHRLPEYAMENRGRIIASLLIMARSWIMAGRPEGGNTTLGSFESWCEIVGGILEYAGLNGFLDNLQEMYRDTADGEDDAEQWAEWMDAIHAHFGDNAFTVKTLAEEMSDFNAVRLRDDAPYSLG
ncbi:MAG: hypothetical protein LBU13_00090, partial [Synergistaceae bacterium]|nr:hypothetical protein [Synergistaceae bacterium]